MAAGLLKVKGTNLFYENYSSQEIQLLGTLTGDSGTAGKLKVKGIYLYYVDYPGNERRLLGWLTGNTGTAGKLKIKGDYIRYIDFNGDEREIRYLRASAGRNRAHLYQSNEDYNEAHGAESGGVWGWGGSPVTPNIGQNHNTKWYIYRGVMAFDTSAIPDDAVITRAWLEMFVMKMVPGADFDIVVVEGNFNIPPVGTNYADLVGCTAARANLINTADMVEQAEVIYPVLNSTGRSEINKTGYTRFAVRTSTEINHNPASGRIAWTVGGGWGWETHIELNVQYEPPV